MDNRGNLAETDHALLCLILLGDDLSRVNKDAMIRGIRALQQPDGSFIPTPGSQERDMRFVYAACAVSAILDDWSGVDKDLVCQYIRQCQCYDGGLSQSPSLESHGGSTFCGIASLCLMGQLDAGVVDVHRLQRWCLRRQTDKGYQGRVGKPADTCYSFWIGASLDVGRVSLRGDREGGAPTHPWSPLPCWGRC